MDVSVKDSNEAIHQINTDVLPDGSETQVVKLQAGAEGVDGGLVNIQNPMPVELGGLFKTIRALFGKFSFDTSSQLRTVVSGYISTVSTVSTANTGISSWGLANTAMEQSHLAFQSGIRKNFTKA